MLRQPGWNDLPVFLNEGGLRRERQRMREDLA